MLFTFYMFEQLTTDLTLSDIPEQIIEHILTQFCKNGQ